MKTFFRALTGMLLPVAIASGQTPYYLRQIVQQWIADVLDFSMARMEAPVFLRLCDAWGAGDAAAARRWNALFLASRESAELRAEGAQMGYSLARLIGELGGDGGPATWEEVAFPAAFAYAVALWHIEAGDALIAYLSDPTLQAGLRARTAARTALFSWDRAAQDTLAVYRQLA